jgi:hypothetical protein
VLLQWHQFLQYPVCTSTLNPNRLHIVV